MGEAIRIVVEMELARRLVGEELPGVLRAAMDGAVEACERVGARPLGRTVCWGGKLDFPQQDGTEAVVTEIQ